MSRLGTSKVILSLSLLALMLFMAAVGCAQKPVRTLIDQTLTTYTDAKCRPVLTRYRLQPINFQNNFSRASSYPYMTDLKCPRVWPDNYEHGHLAPSGDFEYSKEAVTRVNMMDNIVPQNRTLNRGAWLVLEKYARTIALQEKTLTVFTGAIYVDDDNVPEKLFKILCHRDGRIEVWIAKNCACPLERISLVDLKKIAPQVKGIRY